VGPAHTGRQQQLHPRAPEPDVQPVKDATPERDAPHRGYEGSEVRALRASAP